MRSMQKVLTTATATVVVVSRVWCPTPPGGSPSEEDCSGEEDGRGFEPPTSRALSKSAATRPPHYDKWWPEAHHIDMLLGAYPSPARLSVAGPGIIPRACTIIGICKCNADGVPVWVVPALQWARASPFHQLRGFKSGPFPWVRGPTRAGVRGGGLFAIPLPYPGVPRLLRAVWAPCGVLVMRVPAPGGSEVGRGEGGRA